MKRSCSEPPPHTSALFHESNPKDCDASSSRSQHHPSLIRAFESWGCGVSTCHRNLPWGLSPRKKRRPRPSAAPVLQTAFLAVGTATVAPGQAASLEQLPLKLRLSPAPRPVLGASAAALRPDSHRGSPANPAQRLMKAYRPRRCHDAPNEPAAFHIRPPPPLPNALSIHSPRGRFLARTTKRTAHSDRRAETTNNWSQTPNPATNRISAQFSVKST